MLGPRIARIISDSKANGLILVDVMHEVVYNADKEGILLYFEIWDYGDLKMYVDIFLLEDRRSSNLFNCKAFIAYLGMYLDLWFMAA